MIIEGPVGPNESQLSQNGVHGPNAQTNGRTEGRSGERSDTRTNGETEGRKEGRTLGKTDGEMDGWMYNRHRTGGQREFARTV